MIVRFLFILSALWTGGLIWFDISLPPYASDEPVTQAIIVLTGGEGRVKWGLQQLQRGKGRRLLISGAHRGSTAAVIAKVTDMPRHLFKCCVDIGYGAENTVGNAREAEAWLRLHRYHSLRLVTSRYHMRRALLEFHRLMPEVMIVPDPVDSHFDALMLIEEYSKYYARLVWPGKTRSAPAVSRDAEADL